MTTLFLSPLFIVFSVAIQSTVYNVLWENSIPLEPSGWICRKRLGTGGEKKKDDREEGDERADRFPTEISDSVCKGN